MRISLMAALVFMAGCKHLGIKFEPPGTFKAVIQGIIKGVNIHCEKILSLARPNWEVMCKVSDDIDIKYRTQSLDQDQTKVEIIIDKKKGERRKVIAAPVLLVKNGRPARLRTIAASADIDIHAEPER